jgi:hypothetical protein
MEKLKINVDGIEKTINANEKIAKGFYIADDDKTVEKNVSILEIRFDPEKANTVQNRISKIGSWSFLTTKAGNEYIQYIFMSSASEEDFESYMRMFDADPRFEPLIRQAFSMRGNLPFDKAF